MKTLSEVQTSTAKFVDLLTQTSRLVIPNYQREFRWGPKQVKTFVLDAVRAIHDEGGARYYGPATFSGDTTSKERHIVDGQQRITTALLLIAVVRDILKVDGGYKKTVERLNRCLRVRGEDGELLFYRLESQHPVANQVLAALSAGQPVGDAGKKAPGMNYVTAYEAIKDAVESKLPDAAQLDKFVDAFLERGGVTVTLASPANAVEIFIKQHETLSPLGLMDKMKGRLFEHVPAAEQSDFVASFHEAQEILWAIDGPSDKNLVSVLRGMAESGDRTQAQVVVDDAVRSAISVGVLKYTSEYFLPAVKALAAALRGCHPSGALCAPLLDITTVQRTARFTGVRSLYVASRNLTDAQRVEIFTDLGKTLMVLAVSHSNPPDNEKPFRSWTDGVITGNMAHVLMSMKNRRAEHAPAFSTHFNDLGLKQLGQTGVRLLLGIAENHVRTAMGETCNSPAITRFPKDTFDVEHILPQDVRSWSGFEDAPNCVDRLGNLTMLESSRNRSIKNKRYASKVVEYQSSGSYLTRSMHSSVKGTGTNSKVVQGSALLKQFPTWDKAAYDVRSRMLYRLLAAALDIPEVYIQTTSQGSLIPVTATPHNLPQARPGNALQVLLLIGRGITEEDEVAARIAGRDDVGADSRQASYCLDALVFMGLAESAEGVFSLTDPGRELFEEIDKATEQTQREKLRDHYEQTLRGLPGGAGLVDACATPENRKSAVMTAARSMYPQLSDSTLKHRCAALRAWFETPNASGPEEPDEPLQLF